MADFISVNIEFWKFDSWNLFVIWVLLFVISKLLPKMCRKLLLSA